MPNDEQWITAQEAVEISGYSQQYLRRLLRNHKIDSRKFGPVWQVSKLSLLAYINQAETAQDKRFGHKKD